jgi:hypothetical protein
VRGNWLPVNNDIKATDPRKATVRRDKKVWSLLVNNNGPLPPPVLVSDWLLRLSLLILALFFCSSPR